MGIFKTLIATFAARTSPEHVQALNMLNIDFYGIEPVLTSWKTYRKHLFSRISEEKMASAKTEEVKAHLINDWLEKGHNLFIDLLVSISTEVGYSFDHETLKNEIYFPTALEARERDDIAIRQGFLKVITGAAPLSINFPIDEVVRNKQNKLQDSLIDYYDGNRSVKVVIEEKNKE